MPTSDDADAALSKKDHVPAKAFRERMLLLADEYEQLQLENAALLEQSKMAQPGKATEGVASLSVYEVALDLPLLPSTPPETQHRAMLSPALPADGKASLAPIWQESSESSISKNISTSDVDLIVVESAVAKFPKGEARNDLPKISENVLPMSRESYPHGPAASLLLAAVDGNEEFYVQGENDDCCIGSVCMPTANQQVTGIPQAELSSQPGRVQKSQKSVRISVSEPPEMLTYGQESLQVSAEMMQSQMLRQSLRSANGSGSTNGSEVVRIDTTQSESAESLTLPGFQKASPHLQAVFEAATIRALEECYITTKDSCVLSPLSYRRMLWDAILFSCVLFELWVTPFELLFLRIDALPATFRYVSNAMTIAFACDILVNFNTGYISKGEIVMKRSMIARQYLSFWFWLDLLSTLPFDWLLAQLDGNMLRAVKVGRAVRISRAARYLRIMRSYRQRRFVVHKDSRKNGHSFFSKVRPIVPVFCLLLMAHAHACLWGALRPNQHSASKLVDALQDYYECFWQAWTCLFMGMPVGPKKGDFALAILFDMLVSVERICFLAAGGIWAVVYARTQLSDYMRMVAQKEDAIKYLKSHSISMETQLQFRFSSQEMAKAKVRQNHFENLVINHQLTEEMHRRICCELWASRLMSFGLITQIASSNPDFIIELCLCVREEVFASKTVLYHYGDAAIAAYCVLTGRLSCVAVPGYLATTPDYEPGHWLGESALVNPFLRRAMSVITKDMSELMAVPAEPFQSLLSRLGLTDHFQQFIQAHLWKGLCARCGVLGDHFADACPGGQAHRYTRQDLRRTEAAMRATARKRSTIAARKSARASRASTRSHHSWASTAFNESLSTLNSIKGGIAAALESPLARSNSAPVDGIASDLWKYLQEVNLEKLKPHLKELGIIRLDDLLRMDHAILRDKLKEGEELSEHDWKVLSPMKIERFISRATRAVQKQIFGSVTTDHYIFLSHSKLESGTEAALMRTELENLISSDTDSTLNDFDVPIFLDSEDLKSLTDLQDVVDKTHNLVLLLSPTVLQRVWVLVEIATAQKVGVRVVPVHVSKPGTNFEFPKDEFYLKFRSGETLQPEDKRIMETANLTLEEVEDALRNVFKEIAVPYSPHMSSHMRRAQLECLLKRCRLK